MNYRNLYIKNMDIAKSINALRTDMRSYSKVIALYLYNKRIVSIGANKSKTHPLLLKLNYHTSNYFSVEALNDKSTKKSKRPQYPIHAELDGYIRLLNTGQDFNTLFLYRGEDCTSASEPCFVCSKWLNKIDKLVVCYIDVNGNFVEIDSKDLIGHHRHFVYQNAYKKFII